TLTNAERAVVYDVVVSPHPDGGAVVFFDDVTSFHALASRHRDLLERATDAIFTLDNAGVLSSANAATAILLGADRDEIMGRAITTWFDPTEWPALRAEYDAARSGDPRRYECHVVRADGTRRLVSVSNT